MTFYFADKQMWYNLADQKKLTYLVPETQQGPHTPGDKFLLASLNVVR